MRLMPFENNADYPCHVTTIVNTKITGLGYYLFNVFIYIYIYIYINIYSVYQTNIRITLNHMNKNLHAFVMIMQY